MSRDDAAILAHLNAREVAYVVIGGWAVITHGNVRFTLDVDVLIPDDEDSRARTTTALAEIGATTLNGRRLEPGAAMPEQGWQVETDLGRVDVLLEGPPPLDFASVRAGALQTEMDGVPMLVSGLAHLVAFKRLSNRPIDRADLEELERVLGHSLPHLPLPGLD